MTDDVSDTIVVDGASGVEVPDTIGPVGRAPALCGALVGRAIELGDGEAGAAAGFCGVVACVGGVDGTGVCEIGAGALVDGGTVTDVGGGTVGSGDVAGGAVSDAAGVESVAGLVVDASALDVAAVDGGSDCANARSAASRSSSEIPKTSAVTYRSMRCG